MMRKIMTLFVPVLMAMLLTGCARQASPPNTAAPKEGSSSSAAPAAKPSPSVNDPAIKPPTKSRTP